MTSTTTPASDLFAGRFCVNGAHLHNAWSVGFMLFLVPHDAFGKHLYLTLSTVGFVAVAVVNHLFPQKLPWLTHLVKAAYTHLVFASLGVSTSSLWFLGVAAVSILDVVPLALRSPGWSKAVEAVGAWVRLAGLAYGFVVMGFPLWLLFAFGGCSALYFFERRERIRRGERSDYGILHSFEHVGIWLYFVTLNGPCLDVTLTLWGSVLYIVVMASLLVVLGITTNRLLWASLRRDLPAWFDPQLLPLLVEKTADNAQSHKVINYIVKPFTPKMCNVRIRWSDVENMVDRVVVDVGYDVVVGVQSGGAFIARCVADRIGVDDVRYVRSRLWSRQTFRQNLRAIFGYYFFAAPAAAPQFAASSDANLAGKRVLVVDDSVCTGATLDGVTQLCRDLGAAHVGTWSLFCHPAHPTDYCYQQAMTPLIWPWGWESD